MPLMKKTLASIAAVLTLSSTAFAGTNDKFTVTPPSSVKKGQPAVALVHVQGTNGFDLNLDYPVKLTITPPAGVQLVKTTLTKADARTFTKGGADFEIKFTSTDAGKKDFNGELKFAVSTDKDMSPVTEKIAFSVTVN
jgi:hypothetical protein